ncbi:restriction endonuclease [Photobacterium galatheae]|uniref:Uncharacterized protein n=1 Tax=Photobacterium galatheae TaxID=1654360 RepID=A0A066RQS2_9GAMM|nr:restriction endonuclease [Photobacterium galatheae]KDM89723.1 hypothetical protein EA58_21185 [Photobacterium galatheae]MCM0151525.1 restriction endonuclease [Photobacterium galatheae]
MSYYLDRLNSEEFEDLAADIVSKLFNCHVEVFKSGKDKGVDGKFHCFNIEQGIIQAKHWIKSPFRNLISEIEKKEVHKARKLNADRYIFVTSQELSNENKKKILTAFSGCIKETSDIIGGTEIIKFIKSNPEIERKHYKLWLCSFNTISIIQNNDIYGDSDFTLQEIYDESIKYVETKSHQDALSILENKNTLIINGEPGIGKTTLAKNICFNYVLDGYELCDVGTDIRNAKKIYNEEQKQIFYFDDFLGQNYLDLENEREDTEIIKFIKRIKNKTNKKFVLTSRSIILNKKKLHSEKFQHASKIIQNYELSINKLSKIDKSRMLFNHLYHSDLDKNKVTSLVERKLYHTIINHNNYNPRIIEFITDNSRFEVHKNSEEDYLDYILRSLTNPEDIWHNSFISQPHSLKILTCIVAFSHSRLEENQLKDSFNKIKTLDEKLKLESSFNTYEDSIKYLLGSFLNRVVSNKHFYESVNITVFNPSLSDYIINKHINNNELLSNIFSCYPNKTYIKRLSNLLENKLDQVHAKQKYISVLDGILRNIIEKDFHVSDSYFNFLLSELITNSGYNAKNLELALNIIKRRDFSTYYPTDVKYFFKIILNCSENLIPKEDEITFLLNCSKTSITMDDLSYTSKLIVHFDKEDNNEILRELSFSIEESIYDEFESFVEDSCMLDNMFPDDSEYSAKLELEDLFEEFTSNIAIDLKELGVDRYTVINSYDIDYKLKSNLDYADELTNGMNEEVSDDIDETEIDDIFNKLIG